MQGTIRGVYLCNQKRTDELNNRIYQRNTTNAPMKMQYGVRSVPTRYVHMPVVDHRIESCISAPKSHVYDTNNMFAPGSSLPFNGYQKNIDVETKLHNTIFPNQKAAQAKFIPGSSSDLFNSQYLTEKDQRDNMTNTMLFSEQHFSPFNPNTCNMGYKLFNNFTRYQTKDVN